MLCSMLNMIHHRTHHMMVSVFNHRSTSGNLCETSYNSIVTNMVLFYNSIVTNMVLFYISVVTNTVLFYNSIVTNMVLFYTSVVTNMVLFYNSIVTNMVLFYNSVVTNTVLFYNSVVDNLVLSSYIPSLAILSQIHLETQMHTQLLILTAIWNEYPTLTHNSDVCYVLTVTE